MTKGEGEERLLPLHQPWLPLRGALEKEKASSSSSSAVQMKARRSGTPLRLVSSASRAGSPDGVLCRWDQASPLHREAQVREDIRAGPQKQFRSARPRCSMQSERCGVSIFELTVAPPAPPAPPAPTHKTDRIRALPSFPSSPDILRLGVLS